MSSCVRITRTKPRQAGSMREPVGSNWKLLPEPHPDVAVRCVDEPRQRCSIDLTTRPEFHVATALARSLEQASGVRQQRTKEKSDVDVILERVDVAERSV